MILIPHSKCPTLPPPSPVCPPPPRPSSAGAPPTGSIPTIWARTTPDNRVAGRACPDISPFSQLLRFCGFTFCGFAVYKTYFIYKFKKLNRKTAKPQNVKPQKLRRSQKGFLGVTPPPPSPVCPPHPRPSREGAPPTGSIPTIWARTTPDNRVVGRACPCIGRFASGRLAWCARCA